MDKTKLYELCEEAQNIMGAEALLDAFLFAMSSDDIESNLKYINRCYELGLNID